jgi:hypothetical protein
MVDVLYDWLSTHVDMFITGVAISALALMMSMSLQLSNQVTIQQENAHTISSYREFNQYNNKEISLSDYQAALATLVGTTRIVINDMTTGNRYELDWSSSQVPDDAYKFDTLAGDVKINSKLLDYTVAGQPIEEWKGGAVGGVYFEIRSRRELR